MSKGKKVLIIFLTIYFLICAGLIGGYVYIKTIAPDKIIVDDKQIDLQETQDGTDKKPVIEINYKKNTKNEGLELFEVRWNYFENTNKESFDSIGFQYVSTSSDSKIEWSEYINESYLTEYVERKDLQSLWHKVYNAYTATSYHLTSGETYLYCSSDGYETTLSNTEDELLKKYMTIQIGKDIYLMKLKGFVIDNAYITNDGNYYDTMLSFLMDYHYYSFYTQDYSYINHLLYTKFKDTAGGSSKYYKFEFADMFDYYKYDSSKENFVGEKVSNVEEVIELAKTTILIKINISEEGATTASDSLFGSVKGSGQFNLTGEYITSDYYYYGRDVIVLNQKHFEFISVPGDYATNVYALKLKSSVEEILSKYEEDIVLEVKIDLEFFKQYEYIFFGFAEDSGLENFKIYRAYTIDSSGVETEVAYG